MSRLHTRVVRASLGVAALSLGLFGLGACDAIIGIEELRSSPREDDPDPVQCQIPTDCPAAGNSCFLRSCEGGVCNITEAPPGTQVLSQVDGDCSVVICNAEGAAEGTPEPMDVAPDGNECTADVCTENGAENPPQPAGTACSNGVCDGANNCVECIEGGGQCSGAEVCKAGQCVPSTCDDNMHVLPETGVDCGGPVCPPCGDNQPCLLPSDCVSEVCTGNVCQPPSCIDQVVNGNETATDCGGPECPACPDLSPCEMKSDCQSGVCSCEGMACQPICQVPTCFDQVQNGSEVAVDCQGGCICIIGQPCEEHSDCESNNCPMGICEPPVG
jgi:hypothetical protein